MNCVLIDIITNPPILVPIAVPILPILKNIPFANSRVFGAADVIQNCIILLPIPNIRPHKPINRIVGIVNLPIKKIIMKKSLIGLILPLIW